MRGRHFADRREFGRGEGGAGRVVGGVENQNLRAWRDCFFQIVRVKVKILLGPKWNGNDVQSRGS